jgi:hypothetical protein
MILLDACISSGKITGKHPQQSHIYRIKKNDGQVREGVSVFKSGYLPIIFSL